VSCPFINGQSIKRGMKIVLDTNFLVTAVRFKLDWFREMDEHHLYLIPDVEDELVKLSKGKGKDAEAARIALVRLEHMDVLPQPSGARSTDDALLELAKEGYCVATQDAKLRVRIKKAGGHVAYIRQRKRVVVE
jgi:rRNA-processing protein FCF1